MPRWTSQELAAYICKHAAGDKRICAAQPKHSAQPALVSPASGKNKSRSRFKIRFTIYATRPGDWDNYRIKECQDLLTHAGILDGDEWDVLQGEVISCKARCKAEERTVVEIIEL